MLRKQVWQSCVQVCDGFFHQAAAPQLKPLAL